MIKQICILFLWLITYSFIGWVYESTLCSITNKKLTNRGMLKGPYCPIYGFGALIIIGVLSNVKNNPISIFLSSMILTCTLEYFTSWILEVLFNTKWWDYSYMRFNINGRVCLAGALIFATLGTLLMYYVHPAIKAFYFSLSAKTIYISSVIIFMIFMIDFITTMINLFELRNELVKLEAKYIEIEKKAHEDLHELREDIREIINERYYEFITNEYKLKFHFKHLLDNYPTISSNKFPIGLVSLRTIRHNIRRRLSK